MCVCCLSGGAASIRTFEAAGTAVHMDGVCDAVVGRIVCCAPVQQRPCFLVDRLGTELQDGHATADIPCPDVLGRLPILLLTGPLCGCQVGTRAAPVEQHDTRYFQ